MTTITTRSSILFSAYRYRSRLYGVINLHSTIYVGGARFWPLLSLALSSSACKNSFSVFLLRVYHFVRGYVLEFRVSSLGGFGGCARILFLGRAVSSLHDFVSCLGFCKTYFETFYVQKKEESMIVWPATNPIW